MPLLQKNLILDQCPHCSVTNPNLIMQQKMQTVNHAGKAKRIWYAYSCTKCGGVTTAWARDENLICVEIFPEQKVISEDIPERARAYLMQAVSSIHAPSGAVMLAASSVDAMLKKKGYVEGSLYSRIKEAVDKNLITKEMASWAHDVRLDANDQRHADEAAVLPNSSDAKRVIEFATAFGEYLYVLPAKIKRGMKH